jgi:parallel beta-helix repeat protein
VNQPRVVKMKQFLLIAVLTLVVAGFASAQTEISGPQSGTLGPGEYIVTGDLSIEFQQLLTIEPGTTFLFDGPYDFSIGPGCILNAQGTETDSIKFMPNVDNGVTQWGHLLFSYTDDDDVLSYCLITGGYFDEGGGIQCDWSSPTISNCMIAGNSSNYGGGIYCEGSSPMVQNCAITGNTATNTGGGIFCQIEGPTVLNCTITGNTAHIEGGGVFSTSTISIIVNTVITDNIGGGVWKTGGNGDLSVEFCNVFNNYGDDFGGSFIDPGLGVIVGSNANGDSCDVYSNISLDPLYVDPGSNDFHLQLASPCIDAGDPNSPFDPDDTVADIGAFYYHYGTLPIEVSLMASDPLVIQQGENFSYGAFIIYYLPELNYVDIWTEAVLPNGNTYGPIWRINGFPMGAGTEINIPNIYQAIPEMAPLGNYTFTMKVGRHPNFIVDSDSFPFEVEAAGAMTTGSNDWTGYGYEDAFEQARLAMHGEDDISPPAEYEMKAAYPNPFNPTTTVSVSLPETAQLSVIVYNVTGQQVAELANGHIQAGLHQFTLEGSSLASGIYFVQATVPGELNSVQKIVLMK